MAVCKKYNVLFKFLNNASFPKRLVFFQLSHVLSFNYFPLYVFLSILPNSKAKQVLLEWSDSVRHYGMPRWHVCCRSEAEKLGFKTKKQKKTELLLCRILVLQKSCEDTTQSSHTLYPADTSHFHGTFVKTKKLMSVCHCELNSRLYLDFTRFSVSILFPIRDLIQATMLHLVVMSS